MKFAIISKWSFWSKNFILLQGDWKDSRSPKGIHKLNIFETDQWTFLQKIYSNWHSALAALWDKLSPKSLVVLDWSLLSFTAGGTILTFKCVVVQVRSPGQLFATPWAVALQAPSSMGFPRQEYWSGLPFPSPGDLPDPGIKPTSLTSLALQADSYLDPLLALQSYYTWMIFLHILLYFVYMYGHYFYHYGIVIIINR